MEFFDNTVKQHKIPAGEFNMGMLSRRRRGPISPAGSGRSAVARASPARYLDFIKVSQCFVIVAIRALVQSMIVMRGSAGAVLPFQRGGRSKPKLIRPDGYLYYYD
jgi:hypothetical protein